MPFLLYQKKKQINEERKKKRKGWMGREGKIGLGTTPYFFPNTSWGTGI
jgi:hypothetical protein